MILAGFAQLAGAGGAPLVAISMGKKNHKKAEQIMTAIFFCLVAVAILITAVFHFVAEPILRLFGASDEVLPFVMDYCGVYCLGMQFSTKGAILPRAFIRPCRANLSTSRLDSTPISTTSRAISTVGTETTLSPDSSITSNVWLQLPEDSASRQLGSLPTAIIHEIVIKLSEIPS